MKERIITDKTRSRILYSLIALFAFSAAQSVFNIIGERTLGSIARHGMVPLAVAVLIIVVQNGYLLASIFDFRGVGFFSWSQLLVVAIFGIVLGVVVFNYSNFGITYGGIILFILAALGFSVFYIFTGKPFNALCLFWCVYPFIYFIQSDIEQIGFEKPMFGDLVIPFSAPYIIILFVSVILANMAKKDFFRDKSVQFVCWLILFSIPSIFFSADPLKSAVFFFFDIIIPVMFFIIVMVAIQGRTETERFVKFMIISLTTLMLITFYFYRPGEITQSAFGLYEAQNILIPAGTLGCLSVMLLPFSILFYRLGRNKVYLILSLVFTILIILSDTRSPFIGLVIAGVLLFILLKITVIKKMFYLASVFMGIATVLFVIHSFNIHPELKHRIITTIKQLQEGAPFDKISTGRTEIWGSAIRMIADHPLMGIGAGMWQENAPLYNSRIYYDYKQGYEPSPCYSLDAHNFFLDTYLKYGVFTLLLFIWFIFHTLRKSFQAYKREAVNKNKGVINKVSFISMVVWISFASIGYRFYAVTLLSAFFFWSLVALVLRSAEMQQSETVG